MEEVLKSTNYPRARAHPGCEVSCHGTKSTCMSVPSCFVEASLTVEKAILCYKADRLVASLPSFHSIQLSSAEYEFHATGEERCERGHGQVCANL